jgi:hypothetical protein
MIEKLTGKAEMHSLALISDVTYAHQVYWFNNTMKPMKMSLILPKDRPHEGPRPLIVWLCGGAVLVIAMEFALEKKIGFLEWMPMDLCYLVCAAGCWLLFQWVNRLRKAGDAAFRAEKKA